MSEAQDDREGYDTRWGIGGEGKQWASRTADRDTQWGWGWWESGEQGAGSGQRRRERAGTRGREVGESRRDRKTSSLSRGIGPGASVGGIVVGIVGKEGRGEQKETSRERRNTEEGLQDETMPAKGTRGYVQQTPGNKRVSVSWELNTPYTVEDTECFLPYS